MSGWEEGFGGVFGGKRGEGRGKLREVMREGESFSVKAACT